MMGAALTNGGGGGMLPDVGGRSLMGYAVLGIFIAGLASWSAFAPLATGAVASGQVVVESHRKTIQHLEGGIVRDILIREGDLVVPGQVLVQLDDTQSAALSDQLRTQFDTLIAEAARLQAERDDAKKIVFPNDLLARQTDPRVSDAIRVQTALFQNRRLAYEGQLAIVRQRIEQTKSEIRSFEVQATSFDLQLQFIQEELDAVRGLFEKGLERRPRLLALERTAAGLVGSRDSIRGQIAKARQSIGESELQIIQIRNQLQSEVAGDLRDVTARKADIEERLRAASDVQQRRDVQAPVGGMITNLRLHTAGGVVRPGEPILDIVPRDEALIVEVRVQPTDIDVVNVGAETEVRFPAYSQRLTPVILGRVTFVSPDVETDTQSRFGQQAFYRAKVLVSPEQRALLAHLPPLAPGMPIDVVIKSEERTVVEYLLQPFVESFRRAFHEH